MNVLTGKSVSIDNLADSLTKILNSSSDRTYKELPVGDPLESNGTTTKLQKLFNIAPSNFVELNKGLEMTVNDMRSGFIDL